MRLQQQDGAFESSMASCSSRGALLFLHVLRLSNGFATRCFLLHHIVMSNLWLWWMVPQGSSLLLPSSLLLFFGILVCDKTSNELRRLPRCVSKDFSVTATLTKGQIEWLPATDNGMQTWQLSALRRCSPFCFVANFGKNWKKLSWPYLIEHLMENYRKRLRMRLEEEKRGVRNL